MENKAPSTLRTPPLNISVYDGVIGMTGVIYTNWTENVCVDKVKDFADIFHYNGIQSSLYSNAYGMTNSYFTLFTLYTKPKNCEQLFIPLFAANNHQPFFTKKIFPTVITLLYFEVFVTNEAQFKCNFMVRKEIFSCKWNQKRLTICCTS